MEAKQALISRFQPKAVLHALTPEAAHAVPAGMIVDGMVAILRYPFRVGRESRVLLVDNKLHRIERPREGAAEPNNDLYLVDRGNPLQISREHFRIERTPEGYLLVDRGSACGVAVNAARAGGNDAGGALPLKDGDTISVGTAPTPYRYRFIELK
jgi:pSer/pThr/pTyr-binding forkhead associated (FHA) protein